MRTESIREALAAGALTAPAGNKVGVCWERSNCGREYSLPFFCCGVEQHKVQPVPPCSRALRGYFSRQPRRLWYFEDICGASVFHIIFNTLIASFRDVWQALYLCRPVAAAALQSFPVRPILIRITVLTCGAALLLLAGGVTGEYF